MTSVRQDAEPSPGSFSPEMLTMIRMFEASEAPVALLECGLRVLWANNAAVKLNAGLSLADGVIQMLTSYTVERAVAHVGSPVSFTLLSTPAMLTIHLTPVSGGYFANFSPYSDQGTALHPQGQQQLVSAVSGQLRRPLTNMFSSITSMRQLILADEYQEFEPFVNEINENAYKLLRTTVNITSYFKYFSPENEGRVIRINLSEMLGALLSAAAFITRGAGIPITVELPDEPVFVAMDEQQFATALLQVISNSCRFTKPGNAIHVSMSRRGGSAVITMVDSGLGIPRSMTDKVFEPFFSFDHSGMPFAGLGLGLTVARSIIMQMGGGIAISSDEGVGTTVAITLPVSEGGDMSLRAPSPTIDYLRDRFSPLHVMLCDTCGCPAP